MARREDILKSRLPYSQPSPWSELLIPQIPVYELVLRGVVIFFALRIAFRLIGKHEFGQLTLFDLVLLLIISELTRPR